LSLLREEAIDYHEAIWFRVLQQLASVDLCASAARDVSGAIADARFDTKPSASHGDGSDGNRAYSFVILHQVLTDPL
jgi:hypothetical protein